MNYRWSIVLFLMIVLIIGIVEKKRWQVELNKKWKEIGNPSHFFMSPDLIYLYHSLMDIGHYDPKAFYSSIYYTNLILKQCFYIQVGSNINKKELKEPIDRWINSSLNAFHSISVSSNTPSDPLIQRKIGTGLGYLKKHQFTYLRQFYRENNIIFQHGPTGFHLEKHWSSENQYNYIQTSIMDDLVRPQTGKNGLPY